MEGPIHHFSNINFGPGDVGISQPGPSILNFSRCSEELPDLLYKNGRTYLPFVILVRAPCFQQNVSACERKQRASNVPADGDKFETSSGIFIGG